MEIFACPKCGSRNIHIGTIRDGVLDGYTSRYVCRDCDYQGMPIVFDSEEEYISFLQELKEGKKGGSKKGKIRLTEEDKRIVQNSINSNNGHPIYHHFIPMTQFKNLFFSLSYFLERFLGFSVSKNSSSKNCSLSGRIITPGASRFNETSFSTEPYIIF